MRGRNSHTKRELRVDLCNLFSGRCAYCDDQVGMRGTIDHYRPQALGGTNERENLRWCCWDCNQAKGDMSPEEWRQWQPILRPRQRRPADLRIELLQRIARRGRELAANASTLKDTA